MLVGFLMLGEHAGSYRWSEIAAAPLPGGGYLVAAVLLILAGALAKSAIVPFNSWLPVAMAAPTPVSAYLHAAAMVKAGVYLVGLLAPGARHGRPVAAGAAGRRPGHHARRRLGGAAPDRPQAAAGVRHGQPARPAGRGARGGHPGRRAGRRRRCCWPTRCSRPRCSSSSASSTTTPAPATCASSSGLRPSGTGRWRWSPCWPRRRWPACRRCVGFVAKEAVFAAFTDRPVLLAGLVAGHGAHRRLQRRASSGAPSPPGPASPPAEPRADRRCRCSSRRPLLAVAGLVAGPAAGRLDGLLGPYADLLRPRPTTHLALWHGPTPALGLSALALAGGGLLLRRCAARSPRRWPGCARRSPATRGTSGWSTGSTGSPSRSPAPPSAARCRSTSASSWWPWCCCPAGRCSPPSPWRARLRALGQPAAAGGRGW